MTLTLAQLPRSIQFVGLLGALSAIVLIALAPSCWSGTWIQTGLVVAALDLAAMRAGDRRLVLGLAVVGSIVAIESILVKAACGLVPAVPTLVPINLGVSVLTGSSVPRLLGAALHWFSR